MDVRQQTVEKAMFNWEGIMIRIRANIDTTLILNQAQVEELYIY